MRRGLLIACVVVSSVQVQAVESPLPTWAEADRADVKAGRWIPGSLLLTDEVPAGEAPPEKREPLPEPTAEELAVDPTPLIQVPESFLSDYFNERPKSRLIDPQKLLSSWQFQDRLAFLDHHATDSSVDLVIYVFGMNQEIPGQVRVEELAERLYSTGRPTAVICYFLGAPKRSVLYLSPSLTDKVSGIEQNRALQSSVIKSMEKSDAVDQLEAFSLQMSIRLYWLERMLSGGVIPEGIISGNEEPEPKVMVPGASERLNRMIPPQWRLPGGVILGGILVTASMSVWLRQRVRYRFPEFEVEPRLGGDHGAGIGAVISFADASVSPAQQRDQVPDDLGRS